MRRRRVFMERHVSAHGRAHDTTATHSPHILRNQAQPSAIQLTDHTQVSGSLLSCCCRSTKLPLGIKSTYVFIEFRTKEHYAPAVWGSSMVWLSQKYCDDKYLPFTLSGYMRNVRPLALLHLSIPGESTLIRPPLPQHPRSPHPRRAYAPVRWCVGASL